MATIRHVLKYDVLLLFTGGCPLFEEAFIKCDQAYENRPCEHKLH